MSDLSPRKTRTQGEAKRRSVNSFLTSNRNLNKLIKATEKLRLKSDSEIDKSDTLTPTSSTSSSLPNLSTCVSASNCSASPVLKDDSIYTQIPVVGSSSSNSDTDTYETASEDVFDNTLVNSESDVKRDYSPDFFEHSFDERVSPPRSQEKIITVTSPLPINLFIYLPFYNQQINNHHNNHPNDRFNNQPINNHFRYKYFSSTIFTHPIVIKNKNTPPTKSPSHSNPTKMAASLYIPPGANQIFSGKGRITDFLKRFENYSAAFGWSDDVKLAQLQFYLEDAPRQAYNLQMQKTPATKFPEMVKFLTDSFATKTSPEEYRRLLQNRTKTSDETPETYYFDVITLCKKVDQGMKDSEIIKHLVKGLPQSLGKEVFLKKYTKTEEVLNELIEHARFDSLVNSSSNNTNSEVNTVELAVINTLKKLKIIPEAGTDKSSDNNHASEDLNNFNKDQSFSRGRGRGYGRRGNQRGSNRGNNHYNYNTNQDYNDIYYGNNNRGRGYSRGYYNHNPHPNQQNYYPPQRGRGYYRGDYYHFRGNHQNNHNFYPPQNNHNYYSTQNNQGYNQQPQRQNNQQHYNHMMEAQPGLSNAQHEPNDYYFDPFSFPEN